jgi:hypothetical protein
MVLKWAAGLRATSPRAALHSSRAATHARKSPPGEGRIRRAKAFRLLLLLPRHSSEVCLAYAPDAIGYEVPGLRPSQQFDPLIFR